MRTVNLILLICFSQVSVFAQVAPDSNNFPRKTPDSVSLRPTAMDSSNLHKRKANYVKAIVKIAPDSSNLAKMGADTTILKPARVAASLPVKTYQSVLNQLLSANKFIHLTQNPVFFVSGKRRSGGKEYLFYLLSGIILVFGLFKLFYAKYFHNIFRVFFNTSLRQNQLTDLLLQARLPSLIFNCFAITTGGVYVWLLFTHYMARYNYNINLLLFSVLGIGLIYLVKFCTLKFIGWITGMTTALNTYIFVVFLINKIIGIALIPLVLFLAFTSPEFFSGGVILSLLLISIFFIMRFFRSYSLLQQQVNISILHFLLYIISLEILPLLVIYNIAVTLLLKM